MSVVAAAAAGSLAILALAGGASVGSANPAHSAATIPSAAAMHSAAAIPPAAAIPAITIAAPHDGASYQRGARIVARFRCTENGITSPVAGCRGTVANGHALDTRSDGTKSFTVTATDISGNTVTRTVHYTVWEYVNPLREVVRGKRLVVDDDTIVRGNTQRALVRMLREAGAVEVHVRISAPPVKWPCFYGIDFAARAELIASGLDTEGVRASLGADSLGYVSLSELIAATEQPRTRLCRACFDGEYPISLPEVVGKHVLEGIEKSVQRDVEPERAAAWPAGDPLTRP